MELRSRSTNLDKDTWSNSNNSTNNRYPGQSSTLLLLLLLLLTRCVADVHGVPGLLPRDAGAGGGRGRQPRLGRVRGRHQEETPLPRHRLRGRVLLSAAETAAEIVGNLTFLTKLGSY